MRRTEWAKEEHLHSTVIVARSAATQPPNAVHRAERLCSYVEGGYADQPDQCGRAPIEVHRQRSGDAVALVAGVSPHSRDPGLRVWDAVPAPNGDRGAFRF